MICISIANAKGGVGKTTIAANLAYELQRMGASVLMIDLDSQCDLTNLYLGEPRYPDILAVLKRQCKAVDALVSLNERLFILPGSRNINQFAFAGSENTLKTRLRAFKEFDFVIIDHPPSMHAASVAGFVASDSIIIITDPEYFSLQNLGRLLDNLQAIKETTKSDFSILGIVFNKVDLRRSLAKTSMQRCGDIFGNHLFSTYLSYNTAIPTAHSRNMPFRKLPWGSCVEKQIHSLADEMLERMGIEIEP